MLIGDLAETVGINPKTIRYYESIGLLPEPDRTSGGYRKYNSEDIERLAFVRRATALDLHLDEVREILALRDQGEQPCDYVVATARQHLADLDRRLEQMRHARDELASLLDTAEQRRGDDGAYCQLIEHQTDNPTDRTAP